MKRINIFLIIAAVIAGSFICSSCTDLDEKLYNKYDRDKTNFTDEQIEAMMGPVYTYLRWTYWGWNSVFDVYEESADLIVTPKRPGGWGTFYINMHKHTYTSTTCDHFYTLWAQSYGIINNCNQLLEYEVIQSDEAKVAELRGIRVLAYYWLFDNFRYIPLETSFSDKETGYTPTQEKPEVVYQWMLDEMDALKTYFKAAGKPGYSRFNYYAACMIKAKLYLNYYAYFTNGKVADAGEYYKKAYEEANDVVLNGGYTLADNYRDPFKQDGSSCPEIIYAIKYGERKYGATGNYLSNKALHGGSAKTFGLKAAPWNGSCAVPQFLDTYHPADKRKEDTWLIGQQYDQEGKEIYVTVDGEEVPLIYTRDVHSVDNPMAYELEGGRFWKYEIVSGDVGTYSDDVPYFRLADAMFIKAECLLRLGGYNGETEQTAADLVTAVRQRSFRNNPAAAVRTVAQLKAGSVYAYGHDEWQSEGSTNWDPTMRIYTYEGGDDIEFGGLLDDLAWEFVGEHHRRQDLIRFRLTGKDMNVFNGKSWFCKDALTDPTDTHHNIYPIHYSILNANPKLEPTPGYN